MTELEKLKAGEPYYMDDPEIAEIQTRAIELCDEFNRIPVSEEKKRQEILKKALGSFGKGSYVKRGFYWDMGCNIHIGDNFIANYNVTILDMTEVTIGDNVWIGPNVGIYAVAHPMEAEGRRKTLGIAKPIHIGDCVWIGGNSTILMGVTIGKNAIVAAGSVVTKDVPENGVVAGNPAKIIKYIDNKE